MEERISKLLTTDDCEKFARNAVRLGRPDLAEEARIRSVEIRAEEYGSNSPAERECLEAIYAYEEVLTKKNGRRTRATRTWQMIKRHGILEAANRAVNRETETVGYTALAEMGLQKFLFEAVILRHPNLFSKDAVKKSQDRLKGWNEKIA